MAIVKANFRTSSQATKAGGIARSVAYYTFRGRPEQARIWETDDGRELRYNATRREVMAQAREATYTYRIVLSTRDAPLDQGDYRDALGSRFDHWYMTQHHEGEHPHAHVIAFTNQRLGVADLRGIRQELLVREREREQERARGREREREHDLAW